MLVFHTRNRIKACTLAVVVFVVCTVSVSAGADYYVDGDSLGGASSDSNPGTLTQPWRTIGKANAELQPGDTVFIRQGTYNETIKPSRSGTQGNRITYASLDNEETVITGVADAVDLRNRHYIHIYGLKLLNVTSYWVNMRGESDSDSSTRNIIQNCHMENAGGWAGIYMMYGADYNVILDNTLIGSCPCSSPCEDGGPGDSIFLYKDASYNLIEGNTITDAVHNGIELQALGGSVNYNVIKNNVVTNQYHTGINVYTGSHHTLVEGNVIYDCGEICDMNGCPKNYCGSEDDRGPNGHRDRQTGIQWGSSSGIIRNNVLTNNGTGIAMDSYSGTVQSQHNRVYHNTFYQNYHAVFHNCDGPVYDNVFVNNILYSQRSLELDRHITGSPSDNYYIGNNILGAMSRYRPELELATVDELQERFPALFYGNMQSHPVFVDETSRDFHLESTSPMIDAGPFLTATTSSGSGATIPVEDAGNFMDGWGIIEADLIQLKGQSQTARIISVDYDNNRITVDETLTWTAGQGVSLAYHGSAPDIGAFEYISDSTTYTLTVVADPLDGGSVTKTPDRAGYEGGTRVELNAIPSEGYVFSHWLGDVPSGVPNDTNPLTITMDGDKSLTAVFAELPTPRRTLAVTVQGSGSITKTPDQADYEDGTEVKLEATPNERYVFSHWEGDVPNGVPNDTNPLTITMDGDKSLTAVFAEPATPRYALSMSVEPSGSGSVTKAPDQPDYEGGTEVEVEATPNEGYAFSHWSGDVPSGQPSDATSLTITMDANKSLTANFTPGTRRSSDAMPPSVADATPKANAIQVPLNSLVILHVSDAGDGVDASTVTISVNGVPVYTGSGASDDTPDTTTSGVCRRTGTEANYRYAYQAETEFDFGETITVRVNAADLNGNVMAEHAYSFTTEMWAFGANQSIGGGPQGAAMANPATARDSSGNIWVVWQAGAVDQRDVYVSKLGLGDDSFADPIRLTTNTGDQSYPDIAIGADDRLYVVWQDNRRGNWDIYIRTSLDGVNWSTETRIADSDDNQTAPAVAVDGAAGCHVAWEDDRGGHQDIFVASSSDGFASAAVSRVTVDASDPTDPDIAVDASGKVYLVWTDGRNGADDIYGAASSSGSWPNVAVVTGAGNQNAAALATESQGTLLHIVWADDAAGDSDVYLAATDGMPSSPLVGINLVDDTSRADQGAPSLTTTGSTGDGLRVFVCWQDWRNATTAGGDTDLYFVEVGEGDETNVLVGGAGSDQSDPALGVNSYGYPYVVWTDDRNANAGIYYAATMFSDPEILDSQTVTASQGRTVVGVASPSDVDDVSVVIPAAALSQDVTVTITKIRNPQLVSSSNVLPYDFGPSGLEFAQPVTITIPYAVADFGDETPIPWWYDSQTGGLSQQGITGIERVVLTTPTGTLPAVRFTTTHFTPYYLVSIAGMQEVLAASGGSGSAGGCSLSSVPDRSDPMGYFIPYALLAIIMAGLRLRDARRRRASP